MGIMIIAGVTGPVMIAVLVVMVARKNRRPVPATWGSPAAGQCGHHLGDACRCGHGQMRLMWRHGYGQILGCSNYPVCRIAFQFNGQPLPEAQKRALLQIR